MNGKYKKDQYQTGLFILGGLILFSALRLNRRQQQC